MKRTLPTKLLARTALSAGLLFSLAGCGGVTPPLDAPQPVTVSAVAAAHGALPSQGESPQEAPSLKPATAVGNGKGCYYDARLWKETVANETQDERTQ